MIKSVVRVMKWEPGVIAGLFFDDEDYKGLVYWYNDVIEIQPKNKTTT